MGRKKRDDNYRYLNVAISAETLEKLDHYVETSRVPKTAVTEFALLEYLNKYAKEAP